MQLGFVVVRGRSMEPTYVDGDVLLAAYGAQPRIGDPHVVRLPDGPEGPRPIAVKRVTSRGPDGWWVERDSTREGVDSWLVGALADDAVLARVLWPRKPRHVAAMRRCRTLVATFRKKREKR